MFVAFSLHKIKAHYNSNIFRVTKSMYWNRNRDQGLLLKNTCHFFVWRSILFFFLLYCRLVLVLINRFELHTFQWNNNFPVIDRFLSGCTIFKALYTYDSVTCDARIYRASAHSFSHFVFLLLWLSSISRKKKRNINMIFFFVRVRICVLSRKRIIF